MIAWIIRKIAYAGIDRVTGLVQVLSRKKASTRGKAINVAFAATDKLRLISRCVR